MKWLWLRCVYAGGLLLSLVFCLILIFIQQTDVRAYRKLAPLSNLQVKNNKSRPMRILCWILTYPNDLNVRSRHVRDTWARHCDITLFMSSEDNPSFPAIGLNVTEGRNHIASKSKAAWTYIHKYYLDKADFFMKCDPDTYLIVNNLRAYLSTCDPSLPEFFGHQFRFAKKTIYMSGGPGIVLTRESLRRLVEEALVKRPKCFKDGQAEDLKTCMCLTEVGGYPRDTRDAAGRETFVVLSLDHQMSGNFPAWYRHMDVHGSAQGASALSMFPISFHYVKPEQMYVLDYLVRISVQSNQDQALQDLHFYNSTN